MLNMIKGVKLGRIRGTIVVVLIHNSTKIYIWFKIHDLVSFLRCSGRSACSLDVINQSLTTYLVRSIPTLLPRTSCSPPPPPQRVAHIRSQTINPSSSSAPTQ